MPTRSRASLEDIADYLRAQEQVQAEQEYKKNRPWERGGNIMVGDMFGSLQDDPLLRAARERNYDATQASAEYDARTAPGQYVPSWDNPGQVIETQAPGLRAWETPQSVRSELFGGAAPAPAPLPELVKSGSTILARDPITGELVEKYKAPAAPAPVPKPFKLGNTLWDRDPMTGEMAMIAQPPDTSAEKERQVIAAAERRKVGRELELNQIALLKLDPADAESRRMILRNIVGLEEQWRALGNTGAAASGAASDTDTFSGPAHGTMSLRKSPFDIGVESISGGADAAARPSSRSGSPKVGEVRKGYRYRGGNPALKSSWERA